MSQFRMPSLGADMEAGTLTEWLVKPGDEISRGDIVAVVETQKGAIEIEVFENGVVESLLIEPGETVPVGTPMAEIFDGQSGAPAPPSPKPIEPTPTEVPVPAPQMPAAPSPPTAPVQPPAGMVRASPAARRLAASKGIELAAISGSGPDGAVQYADVEAAAPDAIVAKQPAPTGIDAMRGAIAAAMARSKREIPHYYLQQRIDMQAATEWLARTNAERPPAERLLIGVLMIKAIAVALQRFPEMNGFYEHGAYRPSAAIHIGVAIAIRGGGLVAPAIHETDELSLDALMAALRDLAERVRAGRFRGSEIADPTITVSSLGERGVEGLYGVIYPPQVALVGLGTVVERPWVVNGVIAPRPVVTATLSADHRVSDGHRGALLLRKIGTLLQKPEAL